MQYSKATEFVVDFVDKVKRKSKSVRSGSEGLPRGRADQNTDSNRYGKSSLGMD